MSNFLIPKEYVLNYVDLLDEKKQQTTYKIKYVSNYVSNWLRVATQSKDVEHIVFIDFMCNAGFYLDGEIGTSLKVLEMFIHYASQFNDKKFILIINDKMKERVELIEKTISSFFQNMPQNVYVQAFNEDVNKLLENDKYFKTLWNCSPKRTMGIAFVDPYNFCTVKISSLEHFLSNMYCELLFNCFTSDVRRNADKNKMIKFCKEEMIDAKSEEELTEILRNRIKSTKHIQYGFSYGFRTVTNVELYQIMFFTPHKKGLEVLKDALWDTFEGKEFHKNIPSRKTEQLSLFIDIDERDIHLENYSNEACNMVSTYFAEKVVDYITIETFVLENTMLKQSNIINNIIKPMIAENRIKKLGKVSNKNNYKADEYYFCK